MGRLDGKIAIVTGAGSGIGRAVARKLAAEGAPVVATNLPFGGEPTEGVQRPGNRENGQGLPVG